MIHIINILYSDVVPAPLGHITRMDDVQSNEDDPLGQWTHILKTHNLYLTDGRFLRHPRVSSGPIFLIPVSLAHSFLNLKKLCRNKSHLLTFFTIKMNVFG